MCANSFLSRVAKKLLSIPPSSAAAERNFSSLSTVHTKKRNRLTAHRAAKLVYIYHNSRLLKRMKPDKDDRDEDTDECDDDYPYPDAEPDDAHANCSLSGDSDVENENENEHAKSM